MAADLGFLVERLTGMLSAEKLPGRTAPGFLTPVYWSRDPFFGAKATLLGDCTGDGAPTWWPSTCSASMIHRPATMTASE
jgi:hypothetical protein